MHCLAIKMHERARNMRERERTIAVLQHSPCGHNGSQYRQIGNIAINAHPYIHMYVGCVAVAAEVCMRVAQREREAQTTITMTV